MSERHSVNRIYPSKLLLLGEYTVLTGSYSLVIPYPAYRLQLRQGTPDHHSPFFESLTRYLEGQDFTRYGVHFDAQRFRDDLKNGLQFNSDIPVGYGLGSSGALTSALYDLYFRSAGEDRDLDSLREILATIEGFFHGKSSGMDPLISFLDRSVCSLGENKLELVDFDPASFKGLSLALIDSGKSRSTQRFVSIFKEKLKNAELHREFTRILTPATNEVILHLTGKNKGLSLFDAYKSISEMQYRLMPEMITESIAFLWARCLDDEDHVIKLCGAGGGGFYFLLSRDLEAFQYIYPSIPLVRVFG